MSISSDLKLRRREAQARLAAVDQTLGRLYGLRQKVQDAEAALKTHDDDLAADMLQWARDGAAGETPTSDQDTRQRLAIALDRAKADVRAAGSACSTAEIERSEARAEVEKYADQIEDAALEMMIAEHGKLVSEFDDFLAEQVRPKLTRLLSVCVALQTKAEQYHGSGREQRRIRALQMLEPIGLSLARFADLPDPLAPLNVGVLEDADFWTARLGELCGDNPEQTPLKMGLAA